MPLKISLKNFFLLLAVFFSFNALEANDQSLDKSNSAEETIAPKKKKTVCLNMIVKNETDVIRRCLESCKPLIDYWVIVDTGSTDGTQDMIKEFMKDIPGELHERPWKNFAHNRNEALQLAKSKADYLLIIDADETFEYDPGFKFPDLDKNLYYITTKYGGTRYERAQLIDTSIDFVWKGVLHEALYNPEPITRASLAGIYDFVRTDGARSKDPNKFQNDAKILEAAIQEDPTDTRNMFYLAQSYKDAGEYKKAIEYYQKRVDLGGWDQEVFWSNLQIALLQGVIEEPKEKIEKSYFKAYQSRTSRAEPLYYLAQHYRMNDNCEGCYAISKLGLMIPLSKDALFVEKWIYDWGFLLENSVAAYWLGKYHEAINVSIQMLNMPDLPQNIRETVERNLRFAIEKLSDGQAA